MAFVKITEQPSLYNHLEECSVRELLENINNEDKKVPYAVEKAIPQLEKLVTGIVERMKKGGRLFYMGAGTSGRLGVLDASEIPPTFGMPNTLVIGLIAGGDKALRNPVGIGRRQQRQRLGRTFRASYIASRYCCGNRRIRNNALCNRSFTALSGKWYSDSLHIM